MANEIISGLNGGVALTTPAAGDLLPITDISDTTEAATGTTKKITVANLLSAAGASGTPFELVVACSGLDEVLTAVAAQMTFPWPRAVTLTSVHAFLVTPQTSGSTFTVDVNEAGSTILSTKITIDNGETDSTTAATAPVISDSALGAMAKITVDIDQIGDGTAEGLYLVFTGTRA